MPRIIVATDGSPGANRAVDAAAKLAKATRSRLVILTIGRNVSGAELRRLAEVKGDLCRTLVSEADKILGRARQRARRHGITAVQLQSGWGDPAKAIIDSVRAEKPDILVVGKRGHSPLAGLLLGSVSQKLASLAPCKVIVVP